MPCHFLELSNLSVVVVAQSDKRYQTEPFSVVVVNRHRTYKILSKEEILNII